LFPLEVSSQDLLYDLADLNVTRLDSAGNILWGKYYPGIRRDYAMSVKYINETQLYLLAS
jgi:hypothetical protein